MTAPKSTGRHGCPQNFLQQGCNPEIVGPKAGLYLYYGAEIVSLTGVISDLYCPGIESGPEVATNYVPPGTIQYLQNPEGGATATPFSLWTPMPGGKRRLSKTSDCHCFPTR